MASRILLLSAHQPVYLPWLGLFHKIAVADHFIVYDDVPYTRYLWYNRNVVLGANGVVKLTVPIKRDRAPGMTHAEVLINNEVNWGRKHWRSIEQAYAKAPFFGQYAEEIRQLYAQDWDRLIDLNLSQLKLFMKWLGISTPVSLASSHGFRGAKSDRALDMATRMQARALLFGANGRDYADTEAFGQAGVAPLFQEYVHPKYRQHRKSEFQANASVLDLIFNEGPEALDILLSGNDTNASYLEAAAAFLDGGEPKMKTKLVMEQ
jgi:hypothetical protein